MDINDILASLGLDLTNPEVKRGALEAIDAIMQSRQPTMPLGDLGSLPGGEMDVELDPDLIQPSKKNSPQGGSDDDIEIEDEEDILSQIKHNESEDELDDGDADGNDSSSSTSSSNANEASEETDDSSNGDISDSESSDSSDDSQNSGANGNSKEGEASDETEETETASSDDVEDAISDENGEETSGNSADDETEDDSDDFGDSDGSSATNGEESGEAPGEESGQVEDDEAEEGNEFDEDDLLDDEAKGAFDDEAVATKKKARRIKRERTIAAAKKSLADAQAKKVAPALIRELENAIAALESLVEAKTKSIDDISDEEFNMMINRVFDAITAVGDSSLTFSSEEEREIRAKEIKTDLGSQKTQAELSAEDVAQIRAETQAVKAREKETAKYQRRANGSFKGFQDFLNSLYRAIALQVSAEESNDDSWSAINRRYGGTGVLQPGKKLNELPNKKIPVIDFYFDQSGSWDESDIEVGQKAVSKLADMEAEGKIKVNIYYFANNVYTDAQSARSEGGTWAWNEIVKNVIATQATNVVIMTDSDMEDRWGTLWRNHSEQPLRYTVPGYVWYLWRGGSNAPRLPRDLKGRGGVQQFSFNSSDI